MQWWSVAAAGAAVAGCVWWEWWGGKWRRWKLPPGPPTLPFIGNLHLLNAERPWETIQEWGRKYGGIFTVWLGPAPMIVLTDIEIMKESFVGGGYTYAENRCYNRVIAEIFTRPVGLAMALGDDWKNKRRLCMQHLKELGMGRRHMETRILALVGQLLADLKREIPAEGAALELRPRLLNLFTNVILSVTAGQTWTEDDPRYKKYNGQLEKALTHMVTPAGFLLSSAPWLCDVPGLSRLLGWPYCKQLKADCDAIALDMVKEARAVWEKDPSDDSCLLYRFFKEPSLSMENILCITTDFLGAGTDTVNLTTNFALVYFLNYPNWEAACQEEVEKVAGRAEQVTLDDRPNCPILNAFIHESQRLGNILPSLPMHTVNRDGVSLRGYDVPQGIPIDLNICATMRDAKAFPEPEKFRPERFLRAKSEGGWELAELPDALCPFGLGRRNCLGEMLARDSLFLFLANLLQSFRLRPEDPNHPPRMDPVVAYTLRPHPFKIHLTPVVPNN